jgi:hypothetical protein
MGVKTGWLDRATSEPCPCTDILPVSYCPHGLSRRRERGCHARPRNGSPSAPAGKRRRGCGVVSWRVIIASAAWAGAGRLRHAGSGGSTAALPVSRHRVRSRSLASSAQRWIRAASCPGTARPKLAIPGASLAITMWSTPTTSPASGMARSSCRMANAGRCESRFRAPSRRQADSWRYASRMASCASPARYPTRHGLSRPLSAWTWG